MATNANPYVINIVPLQGIASGITSLDTASQITSLQTSVANLQGMVDYDSKTILADNIKNFTSDATIQVLSDINFSTGIIYTNNNLLSNTGSNIEFSSNSYITGTQSTLSFVTAGNEILSILSTGTLQYTSPPSSISTGMNINGFLFVTRDAYVGTLYQRSDRNEKTNIKPFSTCLDDILKLKSCSFDWITSGSPDLGFIAQDVKETWPSLTSDEGTSIAYSRFIPILLEGMRELHSRVSTLEGLRSYK
jgi:hypothetical protein